VTDDGVDADKGFLEIIRQERANLIEQVRLSHQAIVRSEELVRRIDLLLAQAGKESP
jgi:hypothetical protein